MKGRIIRVEIGRALSSDWEKVIEREVEIKGERYETLADENWHLAADQVGGERRDELLTALIENNRSRHSCQSPFVDIDVIKSIQRYMI